MIGVIAEPEELAIAREFFELFKTPWEPHQPGGAYPVVLSTVRRVPPLQTDLAVVYGSAEGQGQDLPVAGGTRPAVLLRYGGKQFPVYGGVSSFDGPGTAVIVREDSGEPVGSWLSDASPRTVRIGFDLFKEVGYLLSAGQPAEFAAIPTLEIHISILRELIVAAGFPLAEIPAVPPGREFILGLTHDVDFASIRLHRADRTVLGFLYRATFGSLARFLKGQLAAGKLLQNLFAAVSLPLVHAGLVRDWFNEFERYRRIEGRLKSTFFLVPHKDVDGLGPDGRDPKGRATRYDIDDIGPEVALLLGDGCEIGLHGIDAWHDEASALEERARIQQAAGGAIAGVRMHWLFFSETTPRVLEEAGFSYDTTWGYNDCVGFRGGTSQVFRPPGAERLLELPLHIQDTALFSAARMRLSEKQGRLAIEQLVKAGRENGGVLTVNWHMRSLGPERHWEGPYCMLLRLAEEDKVWAAPAGQVVEWFRLRRSVQFREVDFGARRIRLSAGRNDSVPGLLLRLHNFPTPEASGVIDVPFSGDLVFNG